jgi:hypothetical protein
MLTQTTKDTLNRPWTMVFNPIPLPVYSPGPIKAHHPRLMFSAEPVQRPFVLAASADGSSLLLPLEARRCPDILRLLRGRRPLLGSWSPLLAGASTGSSTSAVRLLLPSHQVRKNFPFRESTARFLQALPQDKIGDARPNQGPESKDSDCSDISDSPPLSTILVPPRGAPTSPPPTSSIIQKSSLLLHQRRDSHLDFSSLKQDRRTDSRPDLG